MTVMALMQNEIFLKNTPTFNVGTQKLKCTQAPVQSSELLHYHHFGQRSCDPAASSAAFAAPACSSAAVLAAVSGLAKLSFLRLVAWAPISPRRCCSFVSSSLCCFHTSLVCWSASSGGSMTAPFDLAHNHVPVRVLDAAPRHDLHRHRYPEQNASCGNGS